MGKPRIKARIPFSACITVGIVLIGALLVGVFREGLSSILYEPLQTPETWLSNHPYISIGNTILDQPGSTIIVYLLALLTILVGIFFIRTQDGQQSRFWWGLFLVLTGIGAGLAGTSYQAFGYEFKCRGYEYCLWTSWWEITYMICTVAGIGAALVGVAYAYFSRRARRYWSVYSIVSTSIYVIVVLTGVLLSNRFLLSFELMVIFASIGLSTISVQSLCYYRKTRDHSIFKVAWVGIFLVIVIAVYYLALMSGFAGFLYERGIWFTENDLLHVMMIGWIVFIYILLGKTLKDRDVGEVLSQAEMNAGQQ